MRFSIAAFLIFIFSWSSELVSAQVTIGGATRDTLFMKKRLDGTYKSVPKRRATAYLARTYENGEKTEQKLCYIRTGHIINHKYYKEGRPSGKWEYYNDVGAVVRERDFSKLIYEPCEKQADSIPPEGMVLPQFDGGDPGLLKYLSEKVKYPKESLYAKTTGTVYIYFIIDESGKPEDLKICDQGLDGYCDLEVWEIVENMPLWTPGTYKGEKVKVEYYLPIKFSLR